MIKVFTNYKEALNSFEVGNRKHLGITSPGRIRGFDICNFSGLNITIGHEGGTAITQTEIVTDSVSNRGILFTKQGCVIQSDEDLVLSSLANSGNPSVLIEIVICRHTYVEIVGGSIPEFRIEASSYVPLNNEIIIGRIFTLGNATTYNNSYYYPEFNDIGYQLKLSKLIEKAQQIKTLSSGNLLVLSPNDKPIIIINNPDQDLYYISNPHKSIAFTLIIGAASTIYKIQDYTNTSAAPFGYTDIATPKNVSVELIGGNSYEFQWVTLPSFEGWMLVGGNNNASGQVAVDSGDLSEFLTDKVTVNSASGLTKTLLTTSGKKRIEIGIDTDYISNQYIQDTQNYKTALSVLDQDLFQIQKGIMAGLIPESWQTGKLVILSGCLITGTNPGPRTITAGFVYYNGQVYIVNATSFTTGVGEIGIWSIYTAAIYPVMQFTNGATGSGLFDENSINIRTLNKWLQNQLISSTPTSSEGTISNIVTRHRIMGGMVEFFISLKLTITNAAAANAFTPPRVVIQNIIPYEEYEVNYKNIDYQNRVVGQGRLDSDIDQEEGTAYAQTSGTSTISLLLIGRYPTTITNGDEITFLVNGSYELKQ